MFENERRMGSDVLYFFGLFLSIRLALTLFVYIHEHSNFNNYTGDISEGVNMIRAVVIEGLEILINVVNVIPFTKFTMIPAGIVFDFGAGIIFLVSITISGILYIQKIQ